MPFLVTGGAGFIGSHLVDSLMERGEEVRVIDNLSAGCLDNLRGWLGHPSFEFIQGDLLDNTETRGAVEGCDIVYHLAANPEVRLWRASPQDLFKQNVEATYNLLESVRREGDAETLVFSSTSTVYGDATVLPTPETYAPLKPISLYGASKLAAEALVSAYASSYGFRCVVYRMANIVGPRINHGITYDFVEKLSRNPKKLEVLGHGAQSKSYLDVDDCVEGMIHGSEKNEERVEILNIGSDDRTDVKTIAQIIIEEMGLSGVEIDYTGGVNGGRGWKGDVRFMQLDISRLRSLGWMPRLTSAEAVRKTARALVSGRNANIPKRPSTKT